MLDGIAFSFTVRKFHVFLTEETKKDKSAISDISTISSK
jgi:hypothetical protein